MTYGHPSSVTQRHRYPNKMVILPLPPSAQRQGGYVLLFKVPPFPLHFWRLLRGSNTTDLLFHLLLLLNLLVTTTGALALCVCGGILDSSVGSNSQSMLTMFYKVVSTVSVMTVNGTKPPPCLTYGTASCVSHTHIAHIHIRTRTCTYVHVVAIHVWFV